MHILEHLFLTGELADRARSRPRRTSRKHRHGATLPSVQLGGFNRPNR